MLLELTGERSGQARRRRGKPLLTCSFLLLLLRRPYHTDAPISFNWVVIILISKELNATMSRGTLGGQEGARERINLHVVSRIIPRSIRHGNTPSVRPSVARTRASAGAFLKTRALSVNRGGREGKYTGRLGDFGFKIMEA